MRTNTLHGQGIKAAGPRVVIDGFAEDGTPEAIYIKDAPGFTLAVQWHPEWDAGNDPVSRPLFRTLWCGGAGLGGQQASANVEIRLTGYPDSVMRGTCKGPDLAR